MDLSNLVIATTVNGLPALANAGTERFKGLELAGSWYLPRDFIARATYSYHDARFTHFTQEFDGVPTVLDGNRIEMSAHSLASAGVMYVPRRGVFGVASMNFVGSRYLNRRNTALADGFGTLAAGVGYRTSTWEVRFQGRNLTDQRPPVSESELGDGQYYILPSREFGVMFSLRLGG